MSDSATSATERTSEPWVQQRIHHYIHGREVEGRSERAGKVFNPATGEQVAAVVLGGVDEVDCAVASAHSAFLEWREMSLAKRAEVMFRIRNAVLDQQDAIAQIITREHGKVLGDAKGEIARGLEVIEQSCTIPELLKGGFSEQVSTGIDVYSLRQPLGVVAGITPFNFPVMVPIWMWAPAIASGNTFVLKPSEKNPSASLYIAKLLSESGVPPGVFNVVNGDAVAVDRLLEHSHTAAISSVGATSTARHVYETASRHGKRVQALGGAKNHMVVMPDADVEQASQSAVNAAYGSAGERCMAVSVIVAVGVIGDPLVDRIRARIRNITVGGGNDAQSDMGPLITHEHRERVAGHIDRAKNQGATVVIDGREILPSSGGPDGYFLGPTLLDEVAVDMDCYQEEIFGPILSVVRVDSYQDALRLVNKNPYGNGAALFTRDGSVARRFQFDVEVGMVGINVPIPVPVGYYSFGGWKDSLFGDLGIYGRAGVEFYTRPKVVTSRWPERVYADPGLHFSASGS